METGLYAHHLNETEQKILWSEISAPVYNKQTVFYTPKDNLPYLITGETEYSTGNYYTTIRANNKEKTIKTNLEKYDIQINAAVRKLFNIIY